MSMLNTFLSKKKGGQYFDTIISTNIENVEKLCSHKKHKSNRISLKDYLTF